MFLTNQTGRSTTSTISVPPALNRVKAAGWSRNKHRQSLIFQRALWQRKLQTSVSSTSGAKSSQILHMPFKNKDRIHHYFVSSNIRSKQNLIKILLIKAQVLPCWLRTLTVPCYGSDQYTNTSKKDKGWGGKKNENVPQTKYKFALNLFVKVNMGWNRTWKNILK